jgi:hypothetical protein
VTRTRVARTVDAPVIEPAAGRGGLTDADSREQEPQDSVEAQWARFSWFTTCASTKPFTASRSASVDHAGMFTGRSLLLGAAVALLCDVLAYTLQAAHRLPKRSSPAGAQAGS